jgi:hypothetical protein
LGYFEIELGDHEEVLNEDLVICTAPPESQEDIEIIFEILK